MAVCPVLPAFLESFLERGRLELGRGMCQDPRPAPRCERPWGHRQVNGGRRQWTDGIPLSTPPLSRSVQELKRVLFLRVMVHARDAQLGRCRASLRSMQQVLDPFRSILIVLAGWVDQQQQDINDYLKEENRVLWEQLHTPRLAGWGATQVKAGRSISPRRRKGRGADRGRRDGGAERARRVRNRR